jgi:hypothetical protein
MTTDTCQHYWKLGPPIKGVVHGKCIKCLAERNFPAHSVLEGESLFNPSFTDPQVIEEVKPSNHKEGSMGHRLSHAEIKQKHQEYEARKDEILAEYERQGKHLAATAKALKIPYSSLLSLLGRWGVLNKPTKPAKHTLPKRGRASPPASTPTEDTETGGQLPPLPAFDTNWDPTVQVKYLDVWIEIWKMEHVKS